MASSLFLVGEIGGNDYNQALFRNKSPDEVSNYVPDVVAVIGASVTELIELGATKVVVPGNLPIGCSPGLLTKFQTNDTAQYDTAGCLKWANNLAELHNGALKAELDEQGFGAQPLVSCCGGGGPYNCDLAAPCSAKTSVCGDPAAAVSWDGFHLTEHAYKVVADGVLRGPYADPPILSNCASASGTAP